MCCCSYLIWRNAATGSKLNFKYWLLLTFAWICKTLFGIIGLQTVRNGRIGRIKKFTQTLLETWAWFQIRARGCQNWKSIVENLILAGDENLNYRTIRHQGLNADNLALWAKSRQFSINCPGATLSCLVPNCPSTVEKSRFKIEKVKIQRDFQLFRPKIDKELKS